MGSVEHSRATAARDGGTTASPDGLGATVFTDGACSGNPGPGGWAWVEPDGDWASGYDPVTTNQRMELTAVLRAVERFDGPLRIVSDSTYVVNCWRDGWWKGWLKRDWRNSRKEPVANRDLWESLIPHFRDRSDLHMEWVKGHSGDRWNDLADRLAVGAVQRGEDRSGSGEPPEDALGAQDGAGTTVRGADARPGSSVDVDRLGVVPSGESRSAFRRASDPRVPVGHLVAVGGLRGTDAQLDTMVQDLTPILAAQAELRHDVVVLTGLRRGAETAGAIAAKRAEVPYVAVLPYPDPTAGWPEREAAEFHRLLEGAREVTTLERRRPVDVEGRRKSLARRDGWLRSATDAAVIITDGSDESSEEALRRWESVLGAEVWRLDVG